MNKDNSQLLENLCIFFLGLMALSVEVSVSVGGLAFSAFSLFGLILLIKRNQFKKYQLSRSMIFLIILITALVAAIIVNYPLMKEPMRSIRKIRYLVFGLISISTLRYLVREHLTQPVVRKLVYMLYSSVLLATFYSFIVSYVSEYDFVRSMVKPYDGRLHGLTGVMSYGYEMPIIMLSLWGFYIYREKVRFNLNSKFLFFTCIIGTIGITLSGTRGSVLSFYSALPFLYYYKSKKIFITVMGVIVSLILMALIAIQFQWFDNSRLLLKFNNLSNRIRIDKVRSSMNAFKDKPIMGHGLLSWKGEYKTLAPTGKVEHPLYDTHNTYLQVLTDAGIVGFIPFLLFLFFWWRELISRQDIITYVCLPSFIAFLIQCCFHTQFVSGVNTAMNLVMLYVISQLPKLEILKIDKS